MVTQQVGLFPIQTEPHIVVNPEDPQHLVLGVIDYNFPAVIELRLPPISAVGSIKYYDDDGALHEPHGTAPG